MALRGDGDGGVAGGHRLLGGQRPVRGPEGQLVRQRLAALAELRPGVHVEQPDRLQQLPGAVDQGLLAPRPRARGRPPPAPRRSAPAGSSRASAPASAPGSGSASRSSSIAQVRFGAAPAPRTTAGCSSPAWPTTAPSTSSAAQRPGCHGGVLGGPSPRSIRPGHRRRAAPSRPASTASAQSAAPARRPTSRAGPTPRPAPRRRATGCAGTAAVGGGELLVGGPPAPRPSPAARPASARVEDQAELVEGQVPVAPAEVAPQRGQQRASSVVRSSGSSSDSGLASRTACGAGRRPAARARRPARDDERVRQHLDVALLGQRPRRPSGGGAGAGVRPLPGGAVGSALRHLVVPVEADHLLDQVGRVGQVGPPARRGHGQDRPAIRASVGRPSSPCSRPRSSSATTRAGGYATPTAGAGRSAGQLTGVGGRTWSRSRICVLGRAAAVLDQQLDRPLERDQRQLPGRRRAPSAWPPR